MSKRYEVWVEYQDERRQPTGRSFNLFAAAKDDAFAIASAGVLGGMGYVLEGEKVVGYFPGGATKFDEWVDCTSPTTPPKKAEQPLKPLSVSEWLQMLHNILMKTDTSLGVPLMSEDSRGRIWNWVLSTALNACVDGDIGGEAYNAIVDAEYAVASSKQLRRLMTKKAKPKKRKRAKA